MTATAVRKKKKRDPRKTARHKADRLIQEINRLKHKVCLACGKPNEVGHHFIEKSKSNLLRYDLENIIPLCNSCHDRYHNYEPSIIVLKIARRKSEEWALYIEEKRHQMVDHINLSWYRGHIERLEAILDGLRTDNSGAGQETKGTDGVTNQ